MGTTGVNWTQGIDAERLDASRRLADAGSVDSRGSAAIARSVLANYSITVNAASNAFDIATAVREAVQQTHREAASQYGAP
jgi:hypothetical protein